MGQTIQVVTDSSCDLPQELVERLGIEIVPLVREGEHGLNVMGHEIFFYTEGQILLLVSELAIR
jgi:hypothetical protein